MSKTKLVNTKLLEEIKEYGAFDISACFNCGTCTAICPITENDANFPRRIIRYAQLGQQEKLLGSKELWLCYYCGDCTDTCPREADPGEFMMASRRYAIANYDVTGVSKLMYKSNIFTLGIVTILAVVMTLFTYLFRSDPIDISHNYFFQFLKPEYVDYTGLAIFGFIIIAFLAGVIKMIRTISRKEKYVREKENIEIKESIPKKVYRWIKNLVVVIVREILIQKRYFQKEKVKEERLLTSKWFIHLSIVFGFIGLLVATALNYLLFLLDVKPVGTPVPIYYPIRLLGTLAGILLMYGTTVALIRRFQKGDAFRKHSQISDWLFLVLLWGSGLTGFILEVLVYLNDYSILPVTQLYFWMFIVHLVFAGELLMLLPFSKFAHAIYRSLALWYYENIRNAPKTYPEEEAGIIMMED